jgi:hypothetical protein
LQAGRVPPRDERRCSRAKLPADLRDRRLNAANQPGHAEQVELCADVVRICLICEVIARRQDQEHCASITCMIRHYVARRAQVTERHPHNAE